MLTSDERYEDRKRQHIADNVVEKGECLIWQRSHSKSGHGRVSFLGGAEYVHVVVMALEGRPRPEPVDGKRWFAVNSCQNLDCCNPAHWGWELGKSASVQAAFERHGGNWMALSKVAKTHCKRDHEFSEENTYYWTDKDGSVSRYCRECSRLRHEAARERKKAIAQLGKGQK